MDICIVGDAGHTNYVLDAVKLDSSLRIVGIAPGVSDESVAGLLEKVKKTGLNPDVYDDYVSMFEKIKPDIVVAASQFHKQAAITIEALKRDIHVFVEKPVATTMEDLEELRSIYKKSKAQLAAMFGIRYETWFMTAWKLVQQGAIGKIRLMNGQKSYKLGSRPDFYKKRDTYGGTIPWVGSHAVDWLYWFSGERFKNVFASHSSQYNQNHGDLEVTALMQFNFTNQVMGAVNIDYLRPASAATHGDDRIRIAGTEGVIEVRDQKVFLINNQNDGTQEIELEENDGIFLDFIRQIRGEGECLVSAEDSFYITEACLKARESADKGKIVYF